MPTASTTVADALAKFRAGETLAPPPPTPTTPPPPIRTGRTTRITYPRPNGELYYARQITGTADHDIDMMRKNVGATLRENLYTLAFGLPGTGKAVSITTPILTPHGWVAANKIVVGDRLIGRDGEATRVTAVHPQPVKDMHRITFSDGAQVDVCGEHLWQVRHTREQRRARPDECWQVLTTEQIAAHGTANNAGQDCWEIPMLTAPVRFDGTDALPMDAYTLGVWLGDGSSVGTAHPGMGYKSTYKTDHTARITTDLEILRTVGATGLREKPGCWEGRIRIPNSLGLRRKRSYEKFIPAEYLTASPEDRLALLQGLLDTDGHAQNNRSMVQYSTTSEALARGVTELVRSLGGVVTITTKIPTYTYKGEHREGRKAYSVLVKLPPHMAPFRLTRKAEKFRAPTIPLIRRTVTAIEPIGQDASVCFTVDAPDHLFVIDGYIVTHNTAMIEAAFPGLITLEGDGDTTVDDLVGMWAQNPDGTYEWIDGPLVEAAEKGVALFIDEIALIEPKVLAGSVYAAMDGRGRFRVKTNPKRGVIAIEPGFTVIGACNPHAPGARMSEALLSRFSIHLEYTTDYDLAGELGVPPKFIAVAKTLQTKKENKNCRYVPQMRELLAAKTATERYGVDFAAANFISTAPEADRPIVADVVSRQFGSAIAPLRSGDAARAGA